MEHRPLAAVSLTSAVARWDNGRWAVRLGRRPLEKISRGPKGRLRRDRNPPWSVRAKAGLTGPLTVSGPGAKAGPSEPSCPY